MTIRRTFRSTCAPRNVLQDPTRANQQPDDHRCTSFCARRQNDLTTVWLLGTSAAVQHRRPLRAWWPHETIFVRELPWLPWKFFGALESLTCDLLLGCVRILFGALELPWLPWKFFGALESLTCDLLLGCIRLFFKIKQP